MTTETMTNQQIATRLHELVQQGAYNTAYDELFSPDAKAIEPPLAGMGLGEVQGIAAVKAKVAQLGAAVAELTSREMSPPIVADRHIAFTNIVKGKQQDGSDFYLSEVCLYEVQDGKIVSEQFFY